MKRPEHLPDYTKPPLDEVVMGVQFAPLQGYSAVDAQNVWQLFSTDFPQVLEQAQLAPQYEIFGGSNLQPNFQLQLGPPVGSRLWFVAKDGSNLVQFQADRFIANWRKNAGLQPYPRFEVIAEAFEANLIKLNYHCKTNFSQTLEVNQAEVSYINIIPVREFSEADQWFQLWNGDQLNVEALNISFSEVVKSQDGKPIARLHHEIQSVYTADGKQKAYSLNLIFRGKPVAADMNSTMAFLNTGREAIVKRFSEITTIRAHEIWGRTA